MKLEELKAVRKFLKRELKWQEKMFKMRISRLEDCFYDYFGDMDLEGLRRNKDRWDFLCNLLEGVEKEIKEIEKKERRSKKK